MRTTNNIVKFFYNGNETHCVVEDKQGNNLTTGVTTRYAKDKPNKLVARDTAFKRAMKKAVTDELVSKKDREEIWNTYRTTIKQPV